MELLGCQKSSCADVNECMVDNGHCDQICVNKQGSYKVCFAQRFLFILRLLMRDVFFIIFPFIFIFVITLILRFYVFAYGKAIELLFFFCFL